MSKCSVVLDVQAEERLSGFIPGAEYRQILEDDMHSVQDIWENIPDLGRFQ